MDEGRFHELLGRYHDGETSPAENAELESLLRADPECRRIFVERNLMDVQLAKSYAGALVGRPAPSRRTLRQRRGGSSDPSIWTGAAIAAAALFAALLLFASMSSSPPERKSEIVRPKPAQTADEQLSERPPEGAPQEAKRPTPIPQERPGVDRPKAEPQEARRPVEPTEIRPPKVETPPSVPPRTAETAPAETRTAAATVVGVDGEAVALDGAKSAPLVAGQSILTGQGLRTVGEKSALRVKFPDGTQLALEGASEISAVAGKRLTVEQGIVRAQVAKQAPGQPLVFATPHGEAKVLGTSLKLIVDGSSTRLEVTEGRVQLKRLVDGKTVDVITGYYAVAAVGADLVARLLPITDILLAASQAQISGDEWRTVKVEGGVALESLATANFAAMTMPINTAKILSWFAKGQSRSWLVFTFNADADTDYWVWVRGRCIAPAGPGRLRADDVIMEVADATYVRRPADWKFVSDYLCAFNGYGAAQGFWWSGGSHDPGNTQTPIALRFKKSGRQLVRVHAMETPLQIDALWLSTTKATRPGPEEGPGKR